MARGIIPGLYVYHFSWNVSSIQIYFLSTGTYRILESLTFLLDFQFFYHFIFRKIERSDITTLLILILVGVGKYAPGSVIVSLLYLNCALVVHIRFIIYVFTTVLYIYFSNICINKLCCATSIILTIETRLQIVTNT